jgi:hypothetical protein
MKALAKTAIVFLLLAGATFAVLWMGLLPKELSPLSPLSLAKGDQWFVDAKLAALRFDAALCRAVLEQRHADTAFIPDRAAITVAAGPTALGSPELGVQECTSTH